MALRKVSRGIIGAYASFSVKDADGEVAALVYSDPYGRWHVHGPQYLWDATGGTGGSFSTEQELESFLRANVEGL